MHVCMNSVPLICCFAGKPLKRWDTIKIYKALSSNKNNDKIK